MTATPPHPASPVQGQQQQQQQAGRNSAAAELSSESVAQLTAVLTALGVNDNLARSHAEHELNTAWVAGRPDELLLGLVLICKLATAALGTGEVSWTERSAQVGLHLAPNATNTRTVYPRPNGLRSTVVRLPRRRDRGTFNLCPASEYGVFWSFHNSSGNLRLCWLGDWPSKPLLRLTRRKIRLRFGNRQAPKRGTSSKMSFLLLC
ncbi:MAG: hypothetical protein BJ554DRAFT_2087 [Olpidium bornovanus]|uniref:Uncharacterized protein n=1 Tax=Olpidium bornovanus TaxID=278681 RepID=A0A8H8A2J2_9FUNG|nr:MAG: hypothetical protein BJ554DRAFT_2087 [Olpidium bornovanus]